MGSHDLALDVGGQRIIGHIAVSKPRRSQPNMIIDFDEPSSSSANDRPTRRAADVRYFSFQALPSLQHFLRLHLNRAGLVERMNIKVEHLACCLSLIWTEHRSSAE